MDRFLIHFVHEHVHTRVVSSVPFGSLPPHVSLPLTVDGLIQLLVVFFHGVQVAQVAHTQGDGHQSEHHHWFILQNNTSGDSSASLGFYPILWELNTNV